MIWQNVAQTLLLLKADTSDLKAKLKDLSADEKKAAQASIALVEAQNKRYEGLAKAITGVNVVTETATKAVQLFGGAWKEYEKQALAAGGADAEKARAFRGALSSMSTSMDKVKASIGSIVASLAPLVAMAAQVVEAAAWVISNIGKLAPSHGGMDSAGASWVQKATGGGYLADVAKGQQIGRQKIMESLGVAGSGLIQAGGIQTGAAVGKAVKAYKNRGEANPTLWDIESRSGEAGSIYGGAIGDGSDYGLGAGPVTLQRGQWGSKGFDDDVNAILANVNKLQTDRKQSALESIFGPPKEFDAYAAKFQMLSDAVGVFSGALQQGFDAWISGSASAKEALSGVFKATISGLASTMFAHALEEGALAVGALARGIGGNPQGFVEAAAHGKAAAAYGAAGVGIGAIARQFSGGGATAGAGGSAGGGGAPYVGGGDHRSGGGGGTTVVYVGEGWSTTPGQQRQQTARSYRAARRELAGAEGVRDL